MYVGHSFLKILSHLFDHNGVKYWLCSQKAEAFRLTLNNLSTSLTLSGSIFLSSFPDHLEVILIQCDSILNYFAIQKKFKFCKQKMLAPSTQLIH